MISVYLLLDLSELLKPQHTSITQKLPHRQRAKCSKLKVKAKMTNITLLLDNQVIKYYLFIRNLNSDLIDVNTDICGKKQVFSKPHF